MCIPPSFTPFYCVRTSKRHSQHHPPHPPALGALTRCIHATAYVFVYALRRSAAFQARPSDPLILPLNPHILSSYKGHTLFRPRIALAFGTPPLLSAWNGRAYQRRPEYRRSLA